MNVNATSKGNRRFFAIASLGRSRWYWVVWPSLIELQSSINPLFHIAEGVEETKAQAVEKALDTAGRYATWIAAKYARAYYRNTRAGSGRMESAAVPVLHEFLYRDIYDASTQQCTSMPHRIVRKTSNYVFVEQHPYSPEHGTGSWMEAEQITYRLDRQFLEKNGYAFLPASVILTDHEEPVFFAARRGNGYESQLLKCFQVLHLKWPCTVSEVQEAYRRLVKSAHPDGGGSHDQFIELQTAYEQALRLCR